MEEVEDEEGEERRREEGSGGRVVDLYLQSYVSIYSVSLLSTKSRLPSRS
jgi:hypothetical protein